MSHQEISDIVGSNPTIPTDFITDSGNAIPILNQLNILGSAGITTSGAGNTVTISLSGGSTAIDSIAVQTGTSPILPTVAGLVTINGATVAAGTNPVRTDGTGANTLAVEVQISQALAATDATKVGLSNFDSSMFSVDANGFVTLSASASFTTGSVIFWGASSFAQDNPNFFWDDTNNRLGIGTSTPLDTLHVAGSMLLDHTALENDDHAIEIVCNSNGFADVKALDIDYITGALGAGQDEEAILVNIDETGSTGGIIAGYLVLTTSVGSATVNGYETGINVNPIVHESGTFGNADNILNIAVDVTAALASGGAGAISAFVANGNTFTIGDAAQFGELEVILTTGASGAGILALFQYSTGAATFATFVPADGTNNFKNTGAILWDPSTLAGWVTAASGRYEIRITRQRVMLTTTPVIDEIQISALTEFKWDKNGDVNINSLTLVVPLTVPNGGTGVATLTDGGIMLGSGTGAVTVTAQPTNGQLLIGSTGVDPVLGSLTSTGGSVTITPGAGTINLEVAASNDAILTVTGDSGGALSPTAGNINILGSGSITTVGSGSTLTTQLTGLTNHALLVGAGTTTITKVGPTATTGQVLQSQGASADPAFSTTTYPATSAQGDLIYASAANTYANLTKDANATRYLSNQGTSNNPSWNQVNLANGVTGVLPVANGGLNSTAITGIVAGNGTSYAGRTITGTANQVTVTDGNGASANPTISLPSTIYVGGISFDSGTNTLSNYSQGTFTCDPRGTTIAGAVTYSINGSISRYTRTGRMVSITVGKSWATHTGTGNVELSGLPFTSANLGGTEVEQQWYYACGWGVFVSVYASGVGTIPQNRTPINSTKITVLTYNETTGAGAFKAITGTGSIYVNGSYEV